MNSIPDTPYGRLLPHHAALVEQSAISPDVACARGYQSVVVKAELSRLGFGGAQCHVPGLLIPVRGVSGEVVTHQFRPDRPRIVNDKPVKYETPRGSRMAIDVPPPTRLWLGDPTRPLLVTEGIRKADSAATRGLCCVGLLGVWNFRGSNRDGGKVALPDWESIALNSRRVYIVFDSDVMLKPAVNAALVRLKAFLETRGSQVLLIYLPPGDGGIKTGLDDFFSTGATVQDLLALASPTLRPLPAGQADEDTGGYAVEGGCLCRRKHTRDGNITEPLANFAARITEDLALDDGEVSTRAFQIEGSLAGGIPLPSVRVPASRFNAMGWVTEHWGARAVIRAGMSSRDYLREAVQRLSPDVQHRKVFTHTGWREIEGEWAFLTANGAVERDDIEVEVGPELDRYRLPSVPEGPVEAMRLSLQFWNVSVPEVTVPLWAAVYRAPLASLLPADHSIWLAGPTGTLKSTLAALALSHYGDFDRTHLPGTWSSTVNQLERRAFILKDVLFVVDDYAPSGWDIREFQTKAARLLRAQRSGRGRLRSDITERRAFVPRGLIISTAEQQPTGQSVLARTITLAVARGQVNKELLSELQRTAGQLPHALTGYISWLAPRMPTLRTYLPERFATVRHLATTGSEHLRVPEAVSHLWLGLELGLQYAKDIGALMPTEFETHWTRGWEVLMQVGEAQGSLVEEERPTRRFLAALCLLITQRHVRLLPLHEEPGAMFAGPDVIGWRADNFLYLMPDATYSQVAKFCRETGEPLASPVHQLRRDLQTEGLSECEEGRTTTVVKVGGKARRVLKLKVEAIEALLGEELPLV